MHTGNALNFRHPDVGEAPSRVVFEHDVSLVAFDALPNKKTMLTVALGLSLGLWAAIWFGVWALFATGRI
jgi:hypothetical protein